MTKSHKLPRKKSRHSRHCPASPPVEANTHRDRLISELELQVTQYKMQEEEFRRAQGELEGLSEYYSGLFNASPVGYVVLDDVGIIREINQAGATLLRWTRERLVKESFARFVPKEDLAAFLNHFRLCKSTRKQVSTELVLRAHDGRFIPVELVSASFTNSNHQSHYRTVIVDITDRRSAEQALRQSQKDYRLLVDSIEGIVWEGFAGSG